MNAFIAIITACIGPFAPDCRSLVKPELFYNQAECQESVDSMLGLLREQKVLASGNCHKISMGERT